MPGGETHFAPFLTSWLNRTTGEHSSSFKNELCSLIMNTDMNEPTPQNKGGGSENLFIMKQGCRHVARSIGWCTSAKLDKLIDDGDNVVSQRMDHWRRVDGLWGVEQMSPIYWMFQFLGQSAMYYFTKNRALKDNLVENFGSFIHYESLTYRGRDLVNPGMRANGWSNPIDQGLRFIVDDSHPLPKYLKHLKSPLCAAFIDVCREAALHSTPWGLKEPYHIAWAFNAPIYSWIETDRNGNTPARMAVRHSMPLAIMPNNFHVEQRQKGTNQWIDSVVTNGNLVLKYRGMYESLDGYHDLENEWHFEGQPYRVDTYDMSGKHSVEYPVNAQNGTQEPPNIPTPGNPTTPKKEKSSWIERMGL